MDALLDDVVRLAARCQHAIVAMEQSWLQSLERKLNEQIGIVGQRWSGSWLGRHAQTYVDGLRPCHPGEYFDREWGFSEASLNSTRGNWMIYNPETVQRVILERAEIRREDLELVRREAKKAQQVFDEVKSELQATVEAVLAGNKDPVLKKVLREVEDFRSHRFESEYIDAVRPRNAMSRDSAAVMEGMKIPPHLQLFAQLAADLSVKEFLGLLRDKITFVATYLEKRMKMKGTSVAKTGGSIFIGHGGSLVWRDLKDFIQERLGLEWDEFNREPTAGLSTKERLEAMLDKAVFAFLVLTAEDESADGKKHARANVIHEAGLFQGRLGFKRAIVLLEEGCDEFSNIAGLTQIRFPPGKIEAKFEELRRVLEREKIIR